MDAALGIVRVTLDTTTYLRLGFVYDNYSTASAVTSKDP